MPKLLEMYDRNDLNKYLLNSIVLYKGAPVEVVDGITADRKAVVKTLNTGRLLQIPVGELSCSNFPYGFVNYKGNAYYVERTPVRAWKLGITANNVAVRALPNEMAGFVMRKDNKDIISDKGFYNMVKNVYPKKDDVVEMLRNKKPGVNSLAISRSFAIDKKGSLFYKNKQIGCINVDGEIGIKFDYEYLSGILKNEV